MPTQTKRRGELRWRGQIWKNGKVVASRWFGTTKAEQRKAILWEEEKRKELEEMPDPSLTTPMASLSVLDWATAYLDDVKVRCAESTYDEKKRAFKELLNTMPPDTNMETVNKAVVLRHFQRLIQGHSGNRANKDRKNLSKGWEWGQSYLPGFPEDENPFQKVERYPEERHPRYVPPEDDFWKVFEKAEGQDKFSC